MKDKRLEEQFNGYFEGTEIPSAPNSLTDDAKKYVKKRTNKLPMIAKIASVAASFVLVVAISAVLISRMDFNVFKPEDNAPSTPAATTYDVSEIVYTEYSAYTVAKADPKLKFVENLAYSNNAQVENVYISKFADGTKAHAYVKLSVLDETRHDTQIFVEYSSLTFEPLQEYKEGTSGYYDGVRYNLTTEIDEESGEPVNKLFVSYGGVKYYFKITSSDGQSYVKYLQMFK